MTDSSLEIPLNMNSNEIKNVKDPINAQESATKNYVDTNIPAVTAVDHYLTNNAAVSTTSATYTSLATRTIPANTFTNFCIIFWNCRGHGQSIQDHLCHTKLILDTVDKKELHTRYDYPTSAGYGQWDIGGMWIITTGLDSEIAVDIQAKENKSDNGSLVYLDYLTIIGS